MPVTLKGLEDQLRKYEPDWKYELVNQLFEKEGLIRTAWEKDGVKYVMTIDPIVEKDVLCFRVPEIFKAPIDRYSGDALARMWGAMCYINYRIILGKFSYDPRDGEVRFSIDLPVDDGQLTDKQFEHTLRVCKQMVEEYAPKLKAIVEGQLQFEEFIRQDATREINLLIKIFEEFVSELKREVEERTR